MRGERYQNLIATLLIVLALASVSLVVNLSGLWWLWAPLLASLATLAAVFLREVDVPVGSVVALAAGLVLVGRGSKFVKSVGTSLAQQLQAVSPEPARDEVHALLVGGLSTTLRMAREAYEAQRKAYTDSLLTTAIAAFT